MSSLSAAVETAVRLIEGEISQTEYRIALCEIDKIDVVALKAKVVEWQKQVHELQAMDSRAGAPSPNNPELRAVNLVASSSTDQAEQLLHSSGRNETEKSGHQPPSRFAASTVEPVAFRWQGANGVWHLEKEQSESSDFDNPDDALQRTFGRVGNRQAFLAFVEPAIAGAD